MKCGVMNTYVHYAISIFMTLYKNDTSMGKIALLLVHSLSSHC